MENQINDLLTSYQIAVIEIKSALIKAGLSERESNWKTLNLPDFQKMLPEDVLNFYKDLRTLVILYLHQLGLSTREIEKRLKGDSYGSVQNILEANKVKSKKATLEEVSE